MHRDFCRDSYRNSYDPSVTKLRGGRIQKSLHRRHPRRLPQAPLSSEASTLSPGPPKWPAKAYFAKNYRLFLVFRLFLFWSAVAFLTMTAANWCGHATFHSKIHINEHFHVSFPVTTFFCEEEIPTRFIEQEYLKAKMWIASATSFRKQKNNTINWRVSWKMSSIVLKNIESVNVEKHQLWWWKIVVGFTQCWKTSSLSVD